MDELEENCTHYMDKSTGSPTNYTYIIFSAMETHAMKLRVHRLVLMLMSEEGWSSVTSWLSSCGSSASMFQ